MSKKHITQMRRNISEAHGYEDNARNCLRRAENYSIGSPQWVTEITNSYMDSSHAKFKFMRGACYKLLACVDLCCEKGIPNQEAQLALITLMAEQGVNEKFNEKTPYAFYDLKCRELYKQFDIIWAVLVKSGKLSQEELKLRYWR